MSLDEYRSKRDFRRTTEPSGEGGSDPDASERPAGEGEDRTFVVQKHAATRLHYDLRLEHAGVLLSWAVPKGPSLDPERRRLAVRVEDHPLDYGDFEGVIPEEEYGGGTVLLWDRGRWRPADDPEEGLRRGKLSFTLEGEKLGGRWSLVRMGDGDRSGADEWLLLKADDDAARPPDSDLLEERPESVATGRDLDEVARARDRVWSSADRPPPPDPAGLPGARREPLPQCPRPQLAARVESPPAGEEWLHEIKYDGYRIMAVLDGGTAVLVTRNGHDWTDRFPGVAAALSDLPVEDAVVDGEVVVLRPDGTTSFQALQGALEGSGTGPGRITFYGFDLVHLDGHGLAEVPLIERKGALRGLFRAAGRPAGEDGGSEGDSPIRYSDHLEGRGPAFLRQACRFALEGVVSKRTSAPYRPGRSREWRKSKCMERQEFVVGGYTEPSGARTGFGSLLLGYHGPDGELRYAGRVGTGFTERTLGDLTSALQRLGRSRPPFHDGSAAVNGGRDVHWVEPRLVVEVEFSEWTRDGVLRHPSFKGVREDVEPEEVGRERALGGGGDGGPEPGAAGSRTPSDAGGAPPTGGRSSGRNRPGGGRAAPVEIAGVRLTHPDRVLYPDQGVTKRRLAEYCLRLADRILEHVSDRPLTLLRCPRGRQGECFYQKHLNESVPEAVGTVEIEESEGRGTYLTVDSPAGLVALVQMGTLELHPWGSRIDRLERPDRLVFDLDPGTGVSWVHVVEAARELRSRLVDLGLRSFVKTTGGKGLHVVVPLVRRHDWAEAKAFTRAVAVRMTEDAPRRYVATASKAARRNRIYVDYLRNSRGATAVAPYSSRARPGAPVAVPLRWDELGPGTDPGRYTVETLHRRIGALEEEPWRELSAVRQSITRGAREALGIGSA